MKKYLFDLRNTHLPSRLLADFLSQVNVTEQADALGAIFRIGLAAEFEGIDEALKWCQFGYSTPLPDFDWSKDPYSCPALKTRGLRKTLFLIPNAKLDKHFEEYIVNCGEAEYQSVVRRCIGSAISILKKINCEFNGIPLQNGIYQPMKSVQVTSSTLEREETIITSANIDEPAEELVEEEFTISPSDLDPANYT